MTPMRKKSQTLSQGQTRSCAQCAVECLHIEPRADCRPLVTVSSKEIWPQRELRSVGGQFRKEKGHRRDCGQEVLDGEVGNGNLILCYDARDAIFGDGFHDVKRRRNREKVEVYEGVRDVGWHPTRKEKETKKSGATLSVFQFMSLSVGISRLVNDHPINPTPLHSNNQ